MEPMITPTPETEIRLPALKRPATAGAVLIAVMFCLACVALPLADNPTVARLFTALAAIFCFVLTRQLRGVLYYALPALAIYMLSEYIPFFKDPFTCVAAFLAILIGGGCGSFLLTHYHDLKRGLPLLVLPVAAYGVSSFVTGNPLRGLLVLIPTAVAVVAAVCLLRKVERGISTVLITATAAVSLVIAGVVTLGAMNVLNANPLDFLAEEMRLGIFAQLVENRQLELEILQNYQQQFPSLSQTISQMAISSDTELQNTAITVVNVSPGAFLALCATAGFFIWHMLLQQLTAFGSTERLPLPLIGFSVSRIGAVIFLIGGAVALFSGELSVFSTVCLNLAIVLSPGLALIGFSSLFTGQRSCLSLLLALGLLALTFFNPLGGLAAAALLGAVQSLFTRFFHSHNNSEKGEQ